MSTPPEIHYDIVSEIIFSSVEKYPDKIAICDPKNDLSYRDFGTSVKRIANGLLSLGCQPGARCLIILPNSVSFIQTHAAILYSRMISVPCDFDISHNSLRDIVKSCDPSVVVSTTKVIDKFSNLLKNMIIVSADSDDDIISKKIFSLNKILINGEEVSLSEPISKTASIMYTTGTTGQSKGVMLTHKNVVCAINNICDFVGYDSNDREVVVLPLSHNFGLGHVYCNLKCGGSIYTEHGLLRVNRVLKKIESFKATGFPTTPSGVDLLTKRYGEVLEKRLKNLKFSIINSAPLTSEQMITLQSILPSLNIFVYYGMTEASRTTFISLSNKGKDFYESVGKPMKDIQVVIRNENGDELPMGSEGEINISGPTVSTGYWNNLEEDSKSFRDGELISGDLAFMDENGYLYITGRKKDQINVGGYKVNPLEVEEVVRNYPGVIECAVCSVRSDFSEVVALGVVVEDHSSFDIQDLLKSCNDELEHWKIPHIAKILIHIPRTNTGKVKRKELSQLLSEGI